MFDARIFLKSFTDAEKVLLQQKAVFKGDYIVIDKIYRSKDSEQTLDKVFLRSRSIPKNIWGEKPFIVAIKNTEIKKIGKQSIIPLKKEFDTEEEAQKFIEENYADQFSFDYEFHRTGRQYFIGEDGVDLEDAEGYFTIEFKSKTEQGLRNLLNLFNVKDDQVTKGPSVVAIKKILNK